MTIDGIFIRVLGDYGPFSTMGKSIGYQVTIGETNFLVDCGSPLFQQIGGHGLQNIGGLIVTHCHDDHKRWFSDLALFNRYAPDTKRKIPLFAAEKIYEGLVTSSGPALDTSLGFDSKTVVDVAFDDYTDFHLLGPAAKFRIVSLGNADGVSSLTVVDHAGVPLSSDRAKIIISRHNRKPRLLFKDPEYDEWIEPESFYPFSSSIFYESDAHIHHDPEGFTIEAINAPVWHGLPNIGLRFRTGTETLVFSSDTAHDTELWQALQSEKRAQQLPGTRREFEEATVIYGDINDYIERVWSAERFREAVHAFDDAIVIHDIATHNSIVHTDYSRLAHTVLKKENVILTHSPDKMTSTWAMSNADKTFLVRGRKFYEVVDDKLWPMDAVVYHKEAGKYFVGYHSSTAQHIIYENDGILNLGGPWNWEKGSELYKVDLYEDIGGKYFPRLPDNSSQYMERPDGRVELVTFSGEGSRGTIVEDQRKRLSTGR